MIWSNQFLSLSPREALNRNCFEQKFPNMPLQHVVSMGKSSHEELCVTETWLQRIARGTSSSNGSNKQATKLGSLNCAGPLFILVFIFPLVAFFFPESSFWDFIYYMPKVNCLHCYRANCFGFCSVTIAFCCDLRWKAYSYIHSLKLGVGNK